MPARTISAMNAPVYTTRPNNNAANSGVHRKPPWKLRPVSMGIFSCKGGCGCRIRLIQRIKMGTSKYARFHQKGIGKFERLWFHLKINQIRTIEASAIQIKIFQESNAG